MIRTSPPDAKVYVDEQFVGVSPVEYSVPSAKFREGIPLRIERDGYAPVTSTLRTQFAPGRVVGGIFGFGIPFALHPTTTFLDEHDFELQSTGPPAGTSSAAAAPRAPLVPRLAPGSGTAEPSGDTEQKLQRLKQMHDSGLITDEEFRKTRARLVGEL
jgi:hypothetical protein